jgi:mRNA interferase MazF
MNRGDIVIVDLRPLNPAGKVRPVLVIQNDRDNARMANTIVAQITSNLRRSTEDTQLLIDANHADWAASGLRHPSVVNCATIFTVEQQHVIHVIGKLSAASMKTIDACLKAALAIA